MTWQSRPDLNWCPVCWFAGKFESKTHEVLGIRILCLNCGCSYNEADGFPNCPINISDENWDKYWKENFKERV